MSDHTYLYGGGSLCTASRCVAEGDETVGFMVREESGPDDNGWQFFSGREDDLYFMEPGNIVTIETEEILRRQPQLEEYLNSPQGTRLRMADDGRFYPEEAKESSAMAKLMGSRAFAVTPERGFLGFLIKAALVLLAAYLIYRMWR